jgi:hypothetical protein
MARNNLEKDWVLPVEDLVGSEAEDDEAVEASSGDPTPEEIR